MPGSLYKPDGTPGKLLDVSRLHALGWTHRIGLDAGISHAYDWFLAHREVARAVVGGRS